MVLRVPLCVKVKNAILMQICVVCAFSPECSSAAPSAGKEWEEYIQIKGLVEKIRKKQKGEHMCTQMDCWFILCDGIRLLMNSCFSGIY